MKCLALVSTLSVVALAARMNHAKLAAKLNAPTGFTELPGKCTGTWIENWADGHGSHYGEGDVGDLEDCAGMCDQHPECAGFYRKPDGRCSHWRSGSVSATPMAGHTCYVKEGGAAPRRDLPAEGSGQGSCDAIGGYDEAPGKCTGHWIEMWTDGRYAHYGEDYHVSGLDDCADTCDTHPECRAFYMKEGKCSHWRSGSITVEPLSGHCCYIKSSGSFLQEGENANKTETDLRPNDWHARESLVRRYIHHRHENHVTEVLALLTSDCVYHINAIAAGVGEHYYRGHNAIRDYLRENHVEDDEISGDETAARHPSHRLGHDLRVNFQHWEGLGWAGVWVGVYAHFEFRGHGSNTRISKITAGASR